MSEKCKCYLYGSPQSCSCDSVFELDSDWLEEFSESSDVDYYTEFMLKAKIVRDYALDLEQKLFTLFRKKKNSADKIKKILQSVDFYKKEEIKLLKIADFYQKNIDY